MSKADELKKKLMSKPVQTIESSQSTVVSGMTDTQEIKMLKTQEIKNNKRKYHRKMSSKLCNKIVLNIVANKINTADQWSVIERKNERKR